MARRPVLTEEEILARARSVFTEKGYGARTKELAAAVGLTWGAIALRFGDKRRLFMRAIEGPLCGSARLAPEPVCSEDLPDLLQRLRSSLWQRWPLRLQVRLAPVAASRDHLADDLLQDLAGALEARARQGLLRSDVSVEDLVQLVFALLVGDVAQRFVACEQSMRGDTAIIDGVVRLLAAT